MAICSMPPVIPLGDNRPTPQNDVGQLADGGKGQHSFEIVLAQRHEGRHDDGHRRNGADHNAEIELTQQVRSENTGQDTDDAEDPHFHDSHGMQKRTHRGRRHHCRRQPSVKGHNARLGKAENKKDQEYSRKPFVAGTGQKPLIRKLKGTRQMVTDQHCRKHQADGSPQNVGEIFSARGPRFTVLVMRYQRVGGQ